MGITVEAERDMLCRSTVRMTRDILQRRVRRACAHNASAAEQAYQNRTTG